MIDYIAARKFYLYFEIPKNTLDSWLTTTKKSGLAGKICHDFRRSACRNLERAGIGRSAAMAMIGHRTESIYRRYCIADEAMLKDAAVKLERLTPRTSKRQKK